MDVVAALCPQAACDVYNVRLQVMDVSALLHASSLLEHNSAVFHFLTGRQEHRFLWLWNRGLTWLEELQPSDEKDYSIRRPDRVV